MNHAALSHVMLVRWRYGVNNDLSRFYDTRVWVLDCTMQMAVFGYWDLPHLVWCSFWVYIYLFYSR